MHTYTEPSSNSTQPLLETSSQLPDVNQQVDTTQDGAKQTQVGTIQEDKATISITYTEEDFTKHDGNSLSVIKTDDEDKNIPDLLRITKEAPISLSRLSSLSRQSSDEVSMPSSPSKIPTRNGDEKSSNKGRFTGKSTIG